MSSTNRPLDAAGLWQIKRVGTPAPCGEHACLVTVTTFDFEENTGRPTVYRVDQDGNKTALAPAELHVSLPAANAAGDRVVAVVRRDEGDESSFDLCELRGSDEPRVIATFDEPIIDVRFAPAGPTGQQLLCLASVDMPPADKTLGRPEHSSAHVTEDRVYRFWDRWLTGAPVPHLFRVSLDGSQKVDLMPQSRLLFDLMSPLGSFDVADDGTIYFEANCTAPPYDKLIKSVFTLSLNEPGDPKAALPEHSADQIRPRLTKDDRFLVYGKKERSDFYADRVRLVVRDLSSGDERILTDTWDHSCKEWECHGEEVVFTAEADGRTNLYQVSLSGGEPTILAQGGTIAGPRPTAEGVRFQYHDVSTPPEVRTTQVAPGRIGWNDALMASIRLGEVEQREFVGGSDKKIQLWLVHPPGASKDSALPFVHLIHGGPHGTFGDAFHFRWNAQVLAGHGYRIGMTNFHGSSSFGTEFKESILGGWGDLPATDIRMATDWVIKEGLADPERMAITGGSYGGYLTAWIATVDSRYRCGIVHAGVYDTESMYASDGTRGLSLAAGARPWEDQARAERYNPARRAGKIETPLLVIHGEKDYRVPYTQGLQLYGSLRAMGKPARLVVYPDEGHWILKPQNSVHWYGEFAGWLARHLG